MIIRVTPPRFAMKYSVAWRSQGGLIDLIY